MQHVDDYLESRKFPWREVVFPAGLILMLVIALLA